MKKRIMTIVCCTLLVMLLIPQMVFASSDNRLSLKELQELPENMELYGMKIQHGKVEASI